MPLFVNSNRAAIFIHIPKCGGTSVESSLSSLVDGYYMHTPVKAKKELGIPCTPQHFSLEQMRYVLGEKYICDLPKFSVIRNPLNRIVSEFKWDNRRKVNKGKASREFPDFESWLVETLSEYRRNPFTKDNHIRPQNEFIDDSVIVHKLEFSGVEKCTLDLASFLGVDSERHSNHKLKLSGSFHISDNAKDMCYEFYRKDFDLFDYEMDF